MPKNKKKFIDTKNDPTVRTFVVGHRSQRDPLIADETAPQNILIPLGQVPSMSGGGPGAHTNSKEKKQEIDEKVREERRTYGIYFDDEYDYLQHLRNSKEVTNVEWDYCERIYAPDAIPPAEELGPTTRKSDLKDVKLKLPSSVFESEYKEEIGLLNRAATSKGPRPDLDPDIIAALDDDDDEAIGCKIARDDLEDNFIELANQGEIEVIEGEPAPEDLDGLFSTDDEGEEEDHSENESEDFDDERADDLGSLRRLHREYSDDEDINCRFTSYSMSSSVVRRNKQLLLVDDRFEKMYEDYDDTEIGALDCDEIVGDMNPDSDLLLKYAEEFEEDKKKEELVNEKITNLTLRQEDSESDEISESEDEEESKKERWDCESILSTYSNTKNRPKLISEPSRKNVIKVSGKTGIPVGVLGKGLTKQNLKVLDDEYDNENKLSTRGKSMMSGATSIRPKDETPEQRKERKGLVKEFRRERRLERKANTDAFKDEKKRLEKVRLNERHNVQGLKL